MMPMQNVFAQQMGRTAVPAMNNNLARPMLPQQAMPQQAAQEAAPRGMPMQGDPRRMPIPMQGGMPQQPTAAQMQPLQAQPMQQALPQNNIRRMMGM